MNPCLQGSFHYILDVIYFICLISSNPISEHFAALNDTKQCYIYIISELSYLSLAVPQLIYFDLSINATLFHKPKQSLKLNLSLVFPSLVTVSNRANSDLFVLTCKFLLTVCSCHVTYAFQSESHSIIAWMSRNSLLEADAKSEGEVTVTGLEPRTT